MPITKFRISPQIFFMIHDIWSKFTKKEILNFGTLRKSKTNFKISVRAFVEGGTLIRIKTELFSFKPIGVDRFGDFLKMF